MKIAITAAAAGWDEAVDPRFGRAACFVLVDTDTRELSLIDNSQAAGAAQGAGVQAAATICRSGAEVLLTGHCGPKAFATLTAGGVRICTGADGTVAQALARFQAGELSEASAADVAGHWA